MEAHGNEVVKLGVRRARMMSEASRGCKHLQNLLEGHREHMEFWSSILAFEIGGHDRMLCWKWSLQAEKSEKMMAFVFDFDIQEPRRRCRSG